MTNDNPPPQRRWSWMRIGVALIVVAGVLYGGDAYRRRQRSEWYVSEIIAVRGNAQLPEPLLTQILRGRWTSLDRGVQVSLGGIRDRGVWEHPPPKIDAEWLRDHAYFDGLGIRILFLTGTPLPGAEIARIVDCHPIQTLDAGEVQGADDIARALAGCPAIRSVNFEGSDLTDNGLRLLPLERLTELHVAHTQTTPEGMTELRRCAQLEVLSVDGGNAEAAVTTLIAEQRTIRALWLKGRDISDADLERLHELGLSELYLVATSVSRPALAEFKSRMPNCKLNVYERE